MRGEILRIAAGRAEKVVTLRVRSTRTGSPVILRVSRIEAERPLALVISTELVWPEGFDQTVQEAFGLTRAEVEIVQGIALGLPVREIAETRGRSPETVRTQLRSILAKTETHSQSELVRVVLGLMDVAQIPVGPLPATARAGGLEPRPVQELRLADGRRLTWIEFGDPAGRPVLFMHLDYGLIRWPATAERAARSRGFRVIVPVRAGYGRTDPHARGTDHILGVTLDYAAVMDHLGAKGAVVLPLGADLRFAMNLANLRPDLVRGIVGCACQLPLRTAAQYERMDKWQRFILANARYAPKVLPFLVQAGFSLARRLGKEAFFTQVNGGSPADLETFARPEVREAMLEGSETCLARKWSAHEAFTRECISSERDWSGIVRACRVPVLLLQGDQDPQTPMLTVRELMADFPHLEVRFLPQTGQLLFFAEWPQALERGGGDGREREFPTHALKGAPKAGALPHLGYAQAAAMGKGDSCRGGIDDIAFDPALTSPDGRRDRGWPAAPFPLRRPCLAPPALRPFRCEKPAPAGAKLTWIKANPSAPMQDCP